MRERASSLVQSERWKIEESSSFLRSRRSKIGRNLSFLGAVRSKNTNPEKTSYYRTSRTSSSLSSYVPSSDHSADPKIEEGVLLSSAPKIDDGR